MLASLALLAMAQESLRLELVRGASLPGTTIGYWDVTDTTLDASAPDEAQGGSPSLVGGPTRTVLIRFGDLGRAIGRRRVRSASLVLSGGGDTAPKLRSIDRVKAPWGEGPLPTLRGLLRNAAATGRDPKAEKAPDPNGRGATWRLRRNGELPWGQPGALSPEDASPISGASAKVGEGTVTVEGLGPAVAEMATQPHRNFGFALRFDTVAEFASSQSLEGRPRLVVELDPPVPTKGADLAVTAVRRIASGWSARVENLGDAPGPAFAAVWTVNEREGAAIEVPRQLAPGEAVEVPLERDLGRAGRDPRFRTVTLAIQPKEADAHADNDARTAYPDGTALAVRLSEADQIGDRSSLEWALREVDLWNESIAPQSRFSFAPEGATARAYVAAVIGPGEEAPNGLPIVAVPPQPATEGGDVSVQRQIGAALGLTGREALRPSLGSVKLPGAEWRGGEDAYGGILGSGDTRFEGGIPAQVVLPSEPIWSPLQEATNTEATGLLSLTDVWTLNTVTAEERAGVLSRAPKVVLVRVSDRTGRTLPNVELSFFALRGGQVREEAPVFSVVTGGTGTATLPNRDNLGPFGRIGADGEGGAMLVQATANGAKSVTWLKAWQLADLVARGNDAAAILDLRFNLPGAPLDAGSDLALDKAVTDAAGTAPNRLAALVDGREETEVAANPAKGSWIEVDLGRDRTIGAIELHLSAQSRPWARFDVVAYGTGQRPEEGLPFAREIDAAWALRNVAEPRGKSRALVYRGQPMRVRFIRIVPVSAAPGPVGLTGIRVVAAAAP